jgi:heme exporter protein D
MKVGLIFAAVAEAATGLALLIVPSLVGQLLFGVEFTGVTILVARVAGIALIGLGVACWPGPPLVGMLIYSAAVALYLSYIGFADGLTGVFLWPAVGVHVMLAALLARDVMRRDSVPGVQETRRERRRNALPSLAHRCSGPAAGYGWLSVAAWTITAGACEVAA